MHILFRKIKLEKFLQKKETENHHLIRNLISDLIQVINNENI